MSTSTKKKTSRRFFLGAGLGVAGAALAVGRLAHASRELPGARRTLVLLHLDGGNDGLNTLIPYADPLYRDLRPRLSEAASGALPIDDRLAFHPSLDGLHGLLGRGALAVIAGVGYPGPDFSHVGSRAIWAAGTRNPTGTGWIARYLAAKSPMHGAGAHGARVLVVGEEAPPEISGADPAALEFIDVDSPPRVGGARLRDPPTALSKRLLAAADRIVEGPAPEVILVRQPGFDTHEGQLRRHAALLAELDGAVSTFQKDIESRGAAKRTLLLVWSEFGRRAAENAEGGTGHGTAGPVLAVGARVSPGIHGDVPALSEIAFGNLRATTDFRCVYATILSRWLEASPERVVGAFRSLGFLG